eukprot:3482726-Pyramimonas_sp.AAC.1
MIQQPNDDETSCCSSGRCPFYWRRARPRRCGSAAAPAAERSPASWAPADPPSPPFSAPPMALSSAPPAPPIINK